MNIEKKDLSCVDIPKLKAFISANQNKDKAMAIAVVDEFCSNYENWKDLVGYIVGGEDGELLYGVALFTYSSNLYLLDNITKDKVELLQNELVNYESKVKYQYRLKMAMYFNLVCCLHKLSLASNDKLKEYIKKFIYYSLADTNHTSYQIDCYAYRTINEYLLDSLKKETLSMSSPMTFNDPFDCPILELLNLYGDDVSRLISESYKECLKITCFVKNVKLPTSIDNNNNPILEYKHENDPKEYLNELMWAHYANNHMGVCIKYHFNNNITKFANQTQSQIAYFRDIEYTSDMDAYRKNGLINFHDAFFTKGKLWEYENELRLLAFDPKGTGNYASIDIKDSIAAVYFGLKCPKEKVNKIIDILKERKWINVKRKFNEETKSVDSIEEVHCVDFFRMEIDVNNFGKLKAVKI